MRNSLNFINNAECIKLLKDNISNFLEITF